MLFGNCYLKSDTQMIVELNNLRKDASREGEILERYESKGSDGLEA